jgi:hypothetical protein
VRTTLAVFAAACIGCQGAYADEPPDPDATREALVALFAAASEPISPGSSCAGDYLTGPDPTVGDLLAMQMAYLYKGDNVVAGACDGAGEAQCTVSVRHSAGESHFSATIRFRAREGMAMPDTLDCLITP